MGHRTSDAGPVIPTTSHLRPTTYFHGFSTLLTPPPPAPVPGFCGGRPLIGGCIGGRRGGGPLGGNRRPFPGPGSRSSSFSLSSSSDILLAFLLFQTKAKMTIKITTKIIKITGAMARHSSPVIEKPVSGPSSPLTSTSIDALLLSQ